MNLRVLVRSESPAKVVAHAQQPEKSPGVEDFTHGRDLEYRCSFTNIHNQSMRPRQRRPAATYLLTGKDDSRWWAAVLEHESELSRLFYLLVLTDYPSFHWT